MSHGDLYGEHYPAELPAQAEESVHRELIELPANSTINLQRIGDSDWFHVKLNGSPLAEVFHKDHSLWKLLTGHLHTQRTRADLDHKLF